MYYYNNKNFFRILFTFRKGDTIKILAPTLLGMTLYSYGIYYLEVEYLELTARSTVKNINLLHSLLGFVLSLLLVFRTNTAYDRWWEGRKLWGKLVNDSRNFAIKINSYLAKDDIANRTFFKNHIAFFPYSLSNHLSEESTKMALDNDFSQIESTIRNHAPMELLNIISVRVSELNRAGKLSDQQLIVLDSQLSGFLEVCGGCERIKNTPIPLSYSSFIKKFIILYSLALPVAYVTSIGWMMIPLTVFVFYVLMSLEVIAEEIEDPFNNDENDLPIEQMAANIESNIVSIFQND